MSTRNALKHYLAAQKGGLKWHQMQGNPGPCPQDLWYEAGKPATISMRLLRNNGYSYNVKQK